MAVVVAAFLYQNAAVLYLNVDVANPFHLATKKIVFAAEITAIFAAEAKNHKRSKVCGFFDPSWRWAGGGGLAAVGWRV